MTLLQRAMVRSSATKLNDAELELDYGIAVKFSGEYTAGEDVLDRVAAQAQKAVIGDSELRADVETVMPRWSQKAMTRERELLLDEAVRHFEPVDEISAARALHLLAAMGRYRGPERGTRSLYYEPASTTGGRVLVRDHGHNPCHQRGEGANACLAAIQRRHEPIDGREPRLSQLVLPQLAVPEAMIGRFPRGTPRRGSTRKERV